MHCKVVEWNTRPLEKYGKEFFFQGGKWKIITLSNIFIVHLNRKSPFIAQFNTHLNS